MNFAYLVEHGFDVIAFDQPGFGHSGVPDDHSIEFRYRHAVAFLNGLGLKSAFLVGNSIGGLLSILMHHRRKSLNFSIDGLVLAAPFPHFPISDVAKQKYEQHRRRLVGIEPNYESVLALCQNTFFSKEKISDDLVRLRLSMIEGKNWSALLGRRAAGNGIDSDGVDREKISARTLMIWGMNDRSVPVEVGLESVGRFSNAQFVFLPECGHWPQTEQAADFNRIVVAFLSTSDGAIRESETIGPRG